MKCTDVEDKNISA